MSGPLLDAAARLDLYIARRRVIANRAQQVTEWEKMAALFRAIDASAVVMASPDVRRAAYDLARTILTPAPVVEPSDG